MVEKLALYWQQDERIWLFGGENAEVTVLLLGVYRAANPCVTV